MGAKSVFEHSLVHLGNHFDAHGKRKFRSASQFEASFLGNGVRPAAHSTRMAITDHCSLYVGVGEMLIARIHRVT